MFQDVINVNYHNNIPDEDSFIRCWGETAKGLWLACSFLLRKFLNFFFLYINLYIYPPDSQESDEGAIHRVSNYPDLLPEMPRYCCPLVS